MSEEHRSSDPVDVFHRFLNASASNDWDGVADTYAEDVIIEIPFAPKGVPTRSQGRELLRERLKGASKVLKFTKSDNVTVRRTEDPEVIVAEYELHGEAVQTGKPFVFPYIMFVTVRDGEIAFSRDYHNPLASAAALDRVAALVEQYSGTTE